MDLNTLCKAINLPKPAIEAVMDFEMANEQYQKYKCSFEKEREVFFDEVLKHSNYRRVFLYLYMRFSCDAYEEYCLRGISDDVYFNTFSDITLWCENCFRDFGEYGIEQYEWFWRHIELKVFRLGRLQFEPIAFDRTITVNGKRIRKNELVLNVHIPQGQPLSYDECDISFKWAEKFFRGIPPIFVCNSWLLYPGLKEILRPDANIIQFQKFFTIYDTEEDFRGAEERIFINVSDAPDTYPENTGLQKNAKAYLISGKKLGAGLGIMFSPVYYQTL